MEETRIGLAGAGRFWPRSRRGKMAEGKIREAGGFSASGFAFLTPFADLLPQAEERQNATRAA